MAKKGRTQPTAPSAPAVRVTLRRLARDFGEGKKGTIALILNPKVFGSTGENWLGGKTYATKDLAIAAAAAAGAIVVNPPKVAAA